MKKIFLISICCFIILELLVNYLLMPYPGSQSLNSLKFVFPLYSIKIYLEVILVFSIFLSATSLFKDKIFIKPSILIILCGCIYFLTNLKYTAENIFKEPTQLTFKSLGSILQNPDLIVIGVEVEKECKAYPQPYIMYHHQIIDSIGLKRIMVTYCGICQSGRIYEPVVDGVDTRFRLVGIQHGNAVFEDLPTKSWWSQETGICIAGKQKGKSLKEVKSQTMTLQKWSELHPTSLMMEPDPIHYTHYNDFELYNDDPKTNPKILNTSLDWKPKTFIIGVSLSTFNKAYQWEDLKANRLIVDQLDNKQIILMLSRDMKSFIVLETSLTNQITLVEDTILVNNVPFDMNGRNLKTKQIELNTLPAHREYWFSWKHSHPSTAQYLSK